MADSSSEAAAPGPRKARSGPAPSLNKRRAARFAAVQALYQTDAGDQPVGRVVKEFSDYRLGEILEPLGDGFTSPEVDREWFALIVEGSWAERAELDPVISACLQGNWTLARCGYLLRATLRAGAFELARRTDVPVRVVINEYVEVANLFFSGDEPGFVNAVLDRLAKTLRTEKVGL